jgi:hypothetical protein
MCFNDKLSTLLENAAKLNSKLWDESWNIRDDVRESLMQIASDFSKKHNLDIDVADDIVITGSMANYNWNEHSDIDLHILLDFKKINDDVDLVGDYFKLAKSLWNSLHGIEVCDHEVEVYVQDTEEVHHSTGVYSILNSTWVKRPEWSSSQVTDQAQIDAKTNSITDRVDGIDKDIQSGNYEEAIKKAEKLRDKIKRMRSSGLASGGEHSIENLTFKALRNAGELDRLHDLRQAAYDEYRSIRDCGISR